MLKLLLLMLFSGFWISDSMDKIISDQKISKIYEEIGLENCLDWDIFKISMIGLSRLQKNNVIPNNSIITIIDYSKPSTEERFFVLDLQNNKILYSCLVAHGKNSGWDKAKDFSNQSGSFKSCLGFFLTSDTYYGKHGYSLKLKGLESTFNDKAEDRTIVIHKASYVSQEFIAINGRLGRSWGCPALPVEIAVKIINEIKNGTCLFIYANNSDYLLKSTFIINESGITDN